STVIECQRAGLRNSAFEYASTLMRQEYRGQIDKKYRRNIEAIVRRPNRDEEPEPTSRSPISGVDVPITQLECPTTKDAIPMCVVTGRHMVKEDWCICPRSRMPALLSHYESYLQYEQENSVPQGRRESKHSGDEKDDAAGSSGDTKEASAAAGSVLRGPGDSRGYVGFVGKDPVTEQVVRSGELTKATPAEVAECLKQYNEVDGEDDNRPKEGGIGKGDAAG
ncbi:unnamed protein product, partial [Sphacelaria rigidula]